MEGGERSEEARTGQREEGAGTSLSD